MNVSGATNTPIGPLPASPKERIEFAARELEAVWLEQVIKDASPKGSGFLGDSMASKMFKDMFNETIAQKMAEAGTLGLKDQLVRSFQPAISAASHAKQLAIQAMELTNHGS